MGNCTKSDCVIIARGKFAEDGVRGRILQRPGCGRCESVHAYKWAGEVLRGETNG